MVQRSLPLTFVTPTSIRGPGSRPFEIRISPRVWFLVSFIESMRSDIVAVTPGEGAKPSRSHAEVAFALLSWARAAHAPVLPPLIGTTDAPASEGSSLPRPGGVVARVVPPLSKESAKRMAGPGTPGVGDTVTFTSATSPCWPPEPTARYQKWSGPT